MNDTPDRELLDTALYNVTIFIKVSKLHRAEYNNIIRHIIGCISFPDNEFYTIDILILIDHSL